MGALTLKSFPFELRGWDLEKFDNIDPTDSFGLVTKICINNKQILQIEPGYNLNNQPWINDKSRQFFDSLKNKSVEKSTNFFNNTIQTLYKTIYLFELCCLKYPYTHFFTIVYENLSLNLLCLLSIYTQKYSFIKLKKAENKNLNNNIESNFLLNKRLSSTKINRSSLCLFISSNTRLEGSSLNLNIKQRILKGNFKCFMIGSAINLTYKIKFLGNTSTKILNSITEGTHFICQDFKFSKNPIVIFNSEFFKRHDSKHLNKILINLNHLNNASELNTLNSSIFETGIYFIDKPQIFNNVDFIQFSSIYFLNFTSHSNTNINRIIKTNLMYLNKCIVPKFSKVYLNQNFYKNKNIIKKVMNQNDKYLYIPIKMFFETQETYLNTQGLVRQSKELISNNINKSGWKIIRHLFNGLKKNFTPLNYKNNLKINLNLKNNVFKKFINLKYTTAKNLNKSSDYNNNINTFLINKTGLIKIKTVKFFNTKIKFWLNDFFTGGKEEFSKNSLVMIKCSNISRSQLTNFF